MITFENGALTIDTTLSVADSQAISAFADTVRNGEQERIIKLLETDLVENFSDYSDEEECGVRTAIALIKGEK